MGRIKPKRLAKMLAKQAKKEEKWRDLQEQVLGMGMPPALAAKRQTLEYAEMTKDRALEIVGGGFEMDDAGMSSFYTAYLWLRDHDGLRGARMDPDMLEIMQKLKAMVIEGAGR